MCVRLRTDHLRPLHCRRAMRSSVRLKNWVSLSTRWCDGSCCRPWTQDEKRGTRPHSAPYGSSLLKAAHLGRGGGRGTLLFNKLLSLKQQLGSCLSFKCVSGSKIGHCHGWGRRADTENLHQKTLLGLERGLVQASPLVYHTQGWKAKDGKRQSNLNNFIGQPRVCSSLWLLVSGLSYVLGPRSLSTGSSPQF